MGRKPYPVLARPDRRRQGQRRLKRPWNQSRPTRRHRSLGLTEDHEMDNTMKHLLVTAAAARRDAATQPRLPTSHRRQFSGLVATQVNTSFAVGAAITGEFVYDTATSRYLSSLSRTVGRARLPVDSDHHADLFSAIYQAQLSPVPLPDRRNSTFTVDLEGQNPWPSNNALALARQRGTARHQPSDHHAQQLRLLQRQRRRHRRALAHATRVRLQVSAVPEPGTVALMLGRPRSHARRIGRRKA